MLILISKNFVKKIFFFLSLLLLVSCTTLHKSSEKNLFIEGRFSLTINTVNKRSIQGRFFWSFLNFKELFILKDPWNKSQNKISREFSNGKYTDWYFLNNKNQLVSKNTVERELKGKLNTKFSVNEYVKIMNEISVFLKNYNKGNSFEKKLRVTSDSKNIKLLLLIDK